MKLVCGIGINDAEYTIAKCEVVFDESGRKRQRMTWTCPFYRTWKDMLVRCYSPIFHKKYPTYIDCSVTNVWHTFSNFRDWMSRQEWKGRVLDKDLLVIGNKYYSPDTCIFVDSEINLFLAGDRRGRIDYLTGVSWNRRDRVFTAQCSNPFTKMSEHLGSFTCQETAHNAWRARKHEIACLLAEQQIEERVAIALRTRYA